MIVVRPMGTCLSCGHPIWQNVLHVCGEPR